MAEMPPINIQIDEDALRAQVRGVFEDALKGFATQLIFAGRDIWPEAFGEMLDREVKWELERREKNDE